MTQPTTSWTKRFLIGSVDNKNIYLSAPSWDCEWYWGFGYLGNKDCHYHLSSMYSETNMYDALKKHFGDSLTINEDKLWTFCELVRTAYCLKEAAEVIGRGGSHYANNPCADIIKNESETKRINQVVLPAIFDTINSLLFIK